MTGRSFSASIIVAGETWSIVLSLVRSSANGWRLATFLKFMDRSPIWARPSSWRPRERTASGKPVWPDRASFPTTSIEAYFGSMTIGKNRSEGR